MKQRKLLVLLIALFCSVLSFAYPDGDDDPLKTVLAKLERYRARNPQEKIHLHTDKPYYSLGDSIWFKAYILNNEKNQLSALSKIVYVDLINEKDSIKRSLRLPVVAGRASGDFVLSDSLAEGNYRIRAYTTWMRNFGEEFFFDKTIQIGNSLSDQLITDVQYTFSKTGIRENVIAKINYKDINGKTISGKEVNYTIQLDHRNIATGKGTTDANGDVEIKFTNSQPFVLKSGKINTRIKLDEKTYVNKLIPVKTTSGDVDIQFFPEGGQLIDGIRSKVGFKAVGADGLGKEISGRIVDRDNNTLISFKSEFAGIGSFDFTPQRENKYGAIVALPDGTEKRVDLPKIAREGYVLNIDNTDNGNLHIRIAASPSLLNNGDLTLIATTNGLIQYVARNKLNTETFASSIPKKRFQTGIVQFTLLSPNYTPVAERLVFIDNKDQLNVTVTGDKQNYKTREKVTLNMSTKNPEGSATSGSFSVSVINESVIPFDETREHTILSNILFSSDIKGYVERPNYYFTNVNTDKIRQLDNLLLTQGWRRYSWSQILSETYTSTTYSPERSITISGEVTNPNGKPEPAAKVTLLASSGNALVADTVTDANGRFSFPELSFNDSTKFVIQARNSKGRKNVDILIDRIPPQMVTRNKNAPDVEINVNQSILPYLKVRDRDFALMRKSGLLKKPIILQEVKIVQKRPVISNSSNLNGAGNADAVIKADQLRNCLNLTYCLQGMVAGIVVQNGVAYLARNLSASFRGPVPMQLVIDGTFVDPTYLSIITPSDIESIEVLKNASSTAIYGMRGGGGLLLINTKRGERNLSYRNYAPGIANFSPQGLYRSREFYSPAYSAPKSGEAIPDVRNTIYWNPYVNTDSTGKSSFSFFTADAAGTYKVVVEGLNLHGKLGRQVYRFKVE